ncbi:uncharacterized protein LOC111708500 isoform X2 [Eurytemora carolleeae]|uniref:uncharacterized protein LOC111708500 isoform X2 n=1 Tax=Eurytemora carolleeae TaxID=1294199 RepID=UPI000C763047|nr:uncharacterized protein LOC111708500 isoform X2 [Eurytemora carolleeae]|eukprot:XP_023337668.1 uncharacterized protein LOC111708500 isoform X2 [Eurytemora affinis]
MEGETSELDNLDSELVMSFYDQYHADDMSKVYGDISSREEDTGVLDLKNNLALSLIPDVTPQTSQVWNLPDLLVGLDGLQRLQSVSEPTPVCSSSSNQLSSLSIIPSSSSILQQTNSNILNNSSLELSKSYQSDLRPFIFDNFRHCTDSLLEGLGILPPSVQTPVKSEPCLSNSYNGLDNLELEITPFELNLKSEPGLNPIVNISSISSISNLSNISCSSSISSISNLSNYSNISGLDIISSSRCESPLGVDPLIAQHCTLLPPELVSEQGILLPGLRTANFVATVDDITDHPMSEAAQAFIQESLKEEDECLDRPMEMDSNPTYKRCHLCVRIFSTKANLSSHIRHVHLVYLE